MKILNGNAMRGITIWSKNIFIKLESSVLTYYARRKQMNARQMLFPVEEIDSSCKVKSRCNLIVESIQTPL